MATFSIARSNNGFTASVDGQEIGNKVDAAEFRSVGKVVTGLASTFGDAVNDAQANAVDVTSPAQKFAAKPKGMDV